MSDPWHPRSRLWAWPARPMPPRGERVVEITVRRDIAQSEAKFNLAFRLVWGRAWEFHEPGGIDWLLGFVEDSLDFRGGSAWREQRLGMIDLCRCFFPMASDELAFVSVMRSKPRTNSVSGPKARDRNAPVSPLSGVVDVGGRRPLRGVKADFNCGLKELGLGGFRFTYGENAAKPRLVILPRDRMVPIVHPHGNYEDIANEWAVCLGHQEEDRQVLEQGWIPSQRKYFDPSLELLTVPSLVLARLGRSKGREWVTQFNVTLTPGEALITSLMSGKRSLDAFLTQHLVERKLLEAGRILERYA